MTLMLARRPVAEPAVIGLVLIWTGCLLPSLDQAQTVTNLAGEQQMLNPPQVVLLGPTNSTPTATNLTFIDKGSSLLRYSSAKVVSAGTTYPLFMFDQSSGVTGLYETLPYLVELETDATTVQFFLIGNGGTYRFKVDGQYVDLLADSGPPPGGNFYWLTVTFGDSRRRALALELSNQPFGGVAVSQGASVWYPQRPLGPRGIVLGDSYTEPLLCYARRLENTFGWEIWNSGAGGTGYVNPGPAGRVAFGDRLQSDVVAFSPDIVIVAGGLNDTPYPADSVGTAAGALYDAISTNLPSAKLVVVGPWFPTGYPSQAILDVRDAIQAAAHIRGLLFVDPIVSTNTSQVNVGWITGTGRIGDPHYDGNADTFISSDGNHPTDLGHQYLAQKLASYLKDLLVPNPAPTISIALYPGLQISGRIGRTYLIEGSRDPVLGPWTNLASIQLSQNPQLWIDASATNQTRLFYRAVLSP
jgi:lysophospholipase L1-like esterase